MNTKSSPNHRISRLNEPVIIKSRPLPLSGPYKTKGCWILNRIRRILSYLGEMNFPQHWGQNIRCSYKEYSSICFIMHLFTKLSQKAAIWIAWSSHALGWETAHTELKQKVLNYRVVKTTSLQPNILCI